MTPAPPASALPVLPLRRGLRVRRCELILAPHSAPGECVIKDPITGAYFHLGPEESLLLRALDGRNTIERIQRRYRKQFGRPLTREEFDRFTELADSLNLLREKMPVD
jgi:hypothetical protein